MEEAQRTCAGVQLWHSNQAVWYMIEEYQSMQRGQSGWPLSLNRVVDQLLIMCLTTQRICGSCDVSYMSFCFHCAFNHTTSTRVLC